MKNYFQLFDIPVSFSLDESALRQRFYALSRRLHPDVLTDKSPKSKEAALEKMAEVNRGFEVLKDANHRAMHVLHLHGLSELDKPSQAFLTSIMDMNEALMELEFDFDPQKWNELEVCFAQKEEELDAALQKLYARFDQDVPEKKELLQSIFERMSEKKYLSRIKERLSKFAND